MLWQLLFFGAGFSPLVFSMIQSITDVTRKKISVRCSGIHICVFLRPPLHGALSIWPATPIKVYLNVEYFVLTLFCMAFCKPSIFHHCKRPPGITWTHHPWSMSSNITIYTHMCASNSMIRSTFFISYARLTLRLTSMALTIKVLLTPPLTPIIALCSEFTDAPAYRTRLVSTN